MARNRTADWNRHYLVDAVRRLALVLAVFVVGLSQGRAQTLLTEAQELLASDGVAGDLMGGSVAIHGNYAAVGSPSANHSGLTKAGAVYMYHKVSGSWVQKQKITAPNAANDARFGHSVAVSSRWLIVSTYPHSLSQGNAYVYEFVLHTWLLSAQLGAGVLGGYGWDVAIHGDVAVVGSYNASLFGASHGTATVYRWHTATGWALEATLFPPDGLDDDDFGISVDVTTDSSFGDLVIAGAHGQDAAGVDAGAAYLFRHSSVGSWLLEQKLLTGDAAAGDRFGSDVAVSRDTAVVGATLKDDPETNSGAAYGYRFGTAGWTEEKLTVSDSTSSFYFGASVAADGDRIVVSSLTSSPGGAAYLYRDCGGVFSEERKLIHSDSTGGDWNGADADVSGLTVITGSPLHDHQGTDSGAAYLFEGPELYLTALPGSVTAFQPLTYTACGGATGNPTYLFISAVNGIPYFASLLPGTFGPFGIWQVQVIVPNDPGLPGNDISFRLFSFGSNGNVLETNDATVSFH